MILVSEFRIEYVLPTAVFLDESIHFCDLGRIRCFVAADNIFAHLSHLRRFGIHVVNCLMSFRGDQE